MNPVPISPITGTTSSILRLTASHTGSMERCCCRVIGTTFAVATCNRWTRNAALHSGRGVPPRINRSEAQHGGFYLLTPPRSPRRSRDCDVSLQSAKVIGVVTNRPATVQAAATKFTANVTIYDRRAS
jgi:hypothetical protein